MIQAFNIMAQFRFSTYTCTSVIHIHHVQSPGQIEENEHTISSTKEGNQQLRQQLQQERD